MRAAAFFDVDGTIARSNIVEYYVHFRTHGMGPLRRAAWIACYLPQVVRWLVLDRIDRKRMNVTFYRTYRGLRRAEVEAQVAADYPTLLGDRVFADARARIAEHQRRREPVILVTGSLDFIMAPLARDLAVDDVVAVAMTTDADGRLTGELTGPPLGGDEKARAVRAYAAAHDIDLPSSWAYGDSVADLPVLSTVGHAVAVNPGRALTAAATERGFAIERWS